MHLVTNTVEPTSVRDVGDAYVIEDVPFVRAMDLNNGYVPEYSIRESAPEWDGVPATLNHVRDASGTPIEANRKPNLHIGTVEGAYAEGDTGYVRRLRIEKDRLTELGPEAREIRTALENGEPIEVSSQYARTDLPPGEYDGEYRANAAEIAQPDSLAILPNKTGKCSIEDGCGINPAMAANADVSVPMTDDPVSPERGQGEGSDTTDGMDANASANGIEYQGTADGELDESEIPSDDFESHYVFDGETKSDSSFPLVDAEGRLRRGNVESAFNLRGHAPDTDTLLGVLSDVNDAFDDPPIDPEQLDDAMTANAGLVSNIRSFLGWDSSGDEPAESGSGADGTDPDTTSTNTMGDKTQELVANHGFEAENLPSEETECFDRIYDAVTANEATETDETDDSETEQTANEGEDTEPGVREITESELEDLVANRVDERLEEREAERKTRDLAEQVVANSAEYDDPEAVLADYPTEKSLTDKLSQVSGGRAAVPGTGGATPKQTTANADASDFPSPIASERAKELEADD